MGALKGFAIALALLAAPPATAQRIADWQPYMIEASQRFGVPLPWIASVMQAESRGRTMLGGRPIVSRAGAMGLMQLMPATWVSMRDTLGLGRDPFDPHDNIVAGTFYLRLMYDRFGYPGCFAAYNAGPGRYAAYLSGRPLPAETVGYLAATASRAVPAPLAPPALFASVGKVMPVGDKRDEPAPPSLFAIAPR